MEKQLICPFHKLEIVQVCLGVKCNPKCNCQPPCKQVCKMRSRLICKRCIHTHSYPLLNQRTVSQGDVIVTIDDFNEMRQLVEQRNTGNDTNNWMFPFVQNFCSIEQPYQKILSFLTDCHQEDTDLKTIMLNWKKENEENQDFDKRFQDKLKNLEVQKADLINKIEAFYQAEQEQIIKKLKKSKENKIKIVNLNYNQQLKNLQQNKRELIELYPLTNFPDLKLQENETMSQLSERIDQSIIITLDDQQQKMVEEKHEEILKIEMMKIDLQMQNQNILKNEVDKLNEQIVNTMFQTLEYPNQYQFEENDSQQDFKLNKFNNLYYIERQRRQNEQNQQQQQLIQQQLQQEQLSIFIPKLKNEFKQQQGQQSGVYYQILVPTKINLFVGFISINSENKNEKRYFNIADDAELQQIWTRVQNHGAVQALNIDYVILNVEIKDERNLICITESMRTQNQNKGGITVVGYIQVINPYTHAIISQYQTQYIITNQIKFSIEFFIGINEEIIQNPEIQNDNNNNNQDQNALSQSSSEQQQQRELQEIYSVANGKNHFILLKSKVYFSNA